MVKPQPPSLRKQCAKFDARKSSLGDGDAGGGALANPITCGCVEQIGSLTIPRAAMPILSDCLIIRTCAAGIAQPIAVSSNGEAEILLWGW